MAIKLKVEVSDDKGGPPRDGFESLFEVEDQALNLLLNFKRQVIRSGREAYDLGKSGLSSKRVDRLRERIQRPPDTP
ncbi:MAG: hypothetical protein HY558_07125 [Euryarchaeota archaeon]|nr:hypothetical protein [Euryarchaeota archaeon]